uniref:PHD finger protein 7 n=1 Tax=Chrysemys picta bellii TaxID=8478 RepID=A0A8C3FR44_CHRPI
ADSDPDTYGQKCQQGKLCVHENCLVSSSPFPRGLMVLPRGRADPPTCCVCGCKGASVACQGRKCTKNFHFPCGSERGCIYQFFGEFKSFCWKHRPGQRVRRRQQQAETICIICLESMPGKPSYSAMVCPACKHAWFHRGCIQGHALRAALYHFRCPRCRDMGTFQREMFRMGIKIPDRDAAWEEDGAFSDQYHRHSRCDAGCCLYVGGREQSAEAGPWELLLCHSCGSQGTHRRCSSLGATRGPWECEDCAEPAGAGKERLERSRRAPRHAPGGTGCGEGSRVGTWTPWPSRKRMPRSAAGSTAQIPQPSLSRGPLGCSADCCRPAWRWHVPRAGHTCARPRA